MIPEEMTETTEVSEITEVSETSATEVSETAAMQAEQDSETTAEIETVFNTELEALIAQNEQLETLVGYQAEILSKQTEILQYTGYIFAILLVYGLYRFLSGALSSIFGGG